MYLRASRRVGLQAAGAAALLWFVSGVALAQDAEHTWQKQYPVSGIPVLTIETGDSSLYLQSCGECKAIRIQVQSDDKLSRYLLEEKQTGDAVSFSLKEKPHMSAMTGWQHHETRVTVETPAKLQLAARTSDGSVSVRGVEGALQVHTSDGHMTVEDVRGDLRVTSSDGGMTIHNAAGTLEARGSDGHMVVDGQFSAVQMHTSDGDLEFALAPGSQLTAASRIESSDGRVTIRVSQDLAATLDVSTSDGRVDCTLPLTMDHYDSRESSGHRLHGQLNKGGVPFSIHTSDGSVSITSL